MNFLIYLKLMQAFQALIPWAETEILRERASIARRKVFARPESFCAWIVKRKIFTLSGNFSDFLEIFSDFLESFPDCLENFPDCLKSFPEILNVFRIVWKVFRIV